MIEFMNNLYFKQFFVGLMDGDGSIQVNHWKKKLLQFRFVIKLKNTKHNQKMLFLLKKHIGGNVKTIFSQKTKKNEVVWVENNKKKIISLLSIFDSYPALTSRLSFQLLFLKKYIFFASSCFQFDSFLEERKNKYKEKLDDLKQTNILCELYTLPYFPSWLSGFIEAEACFCLRQKKNHSFSISQKNDFFLLQNIQTYLQDSGKIRKKKQNVFILEIYKKKILEQLFSHLQKYPLLGEKNESFVLFKKQIQKKKKNKE